MTRAVRITFAVAAVLGLGTGLGWGYATGRDISQLYADSLPEMAPMLGDFAVQQVESADTDHARQALRLEISILEKIELLIDNKCCRGELALAYVRLGTVEDAAGQTQAKEAAFNQARRLFGRNGLTDDEMRSIVKKIDGANARIDPTSH